MASPGPFIDSEWLLLRAQQCRVVGSGFKDTETRDKMLGLATYYEQLAETIDRPVGSPMPSTASPKSLRSSPVR